MKTIKFLLILVVAFIFMGNVNAQTNLAAWHFDVLAAAPNTPKIIQADYGLQSNSATIYLDGTHGSSDWNSSTTNPELTSFGGSTTNDQRPSPNAGQSLALANSSANGKGLVFALSTENYENIKISYAYKATSAGFKIHRWFYSINGTDFIIIDSVSITRDASWHTLNIDFSNIAAIEDLSSLLLKVVVDSASSASGNNRIDNFYITGEEITPTDTIPPTLISAEAISDNQAKIAFSEPVDATAENVNNYSITLGVSSAVRLTGLDSVLITFTQPLVPNTEYQLCASGIQDLAGNAMTSSQCDNIEWITTQPQDTIPPQPLNAWLENLSEVKVSFNEPVDASAENIANYTGINVATATRNTTLDTVTLTLSTPIANATPTTMYVSNISDTAGNVNTNVYEFTLFMDTVAHTPNWVITEIMYNPPESGIDSLEFIEIMNNTAFMMNFKNYTLKYGTTSFTFSEDINVNPYGYVLVAPVANKASAFYGKTFIQGSTIGISNSGTAIVIKDPNGITVDTVRYYTTAPWPTDANANGYSLSLCDPSLDNNDGANWSLGTRPFTIVNGKMVYADPGEGCYVAPDTIPPTMISAAAISATQAKIAFSEPVDATAEDVNNYSITVGVSSAVRLTGLDSVLLTFTQPLVSNTKYQLCVSGIQDVEGNIMPAPECDSIEWIVALPQDTVPPIPLNAWLETLSTVKVSFDEPVDASAENTANYTGINVATAIRNASLDTVTLTLTAPIANATPTTLYVSNISDTAGNLNTNVYDFTLFMDTVQHTANWVITEIMYNPPEIGTDSLEFIEIKNNTAFTMNFKGYTLKYGTTSHTFTEDLFVDPYGYVLVAPVANKASAFYGKTFIQGATGGISNSGTSIVIKDPNGITVDTVKYSTTAPWPTDANSGGYSLSLCDPNLDNNIGSNWSLGTRPFSIVNTKMVYADPGEGCYVEIDTIPPTMISAAAISDTQAKIAFSEPVDATAEDVNNYSITTGVSSAVRLTGHDTVLLTFTQPLIHNTKYQLCVSGIQDLEGNIMPAPECDSIEWIVSTAPDTVPPIPLNAWVETLSTVKVSFNEPVDATAENTANYTGINVATAIRNASLDTVTLTLTAPIANATPTTMYVSNISDTAGNLNTNVYDFTLFLDTVQHTANWVITEIMYNPPEIGTDSLEFIEIKNNTAFTMNFKGYTLKYGTSATFTFSEDLFVDPYGYVLVAPVANKASAFYGKTFIQGSNIGITNGGTSIVIKDPNGITVDTVKYSNTAPWPTDANGGGYSLSLCDPNLDNNIGSNWSLGTRPFSIVNNKMVYADPGEGCYVAPDTIPPTPLNAWATSYTTVKISFDEPVNNSAENINNYGGLDISTATRNTTHDTVTLTLATPLQNAVHYTLTITNIADEAGNINSNIYDFDISIDLSAPNIVITEIMYNPPESGTDSLEFIELYNNETYTVNMKDYTLTYGTNTFTFPDGITIAPNAFLIIAPNATAVNNFYGITAIQGSTGGISNSGNAILVKSPYGVLVDSLTFGNSAPWPTEANGQGPSLTLCDPNSDNTDPANWSVSDHEYSIVNGYMVKADPNSLCIINNVADFNKEIINIYPNPASDKVFINTNKTINSIVIYDILGNQVAHYEQVNDNQYIIDVNNLLAQIYIVKIVFVDNSIANKKLIIE